MFATHARARGEEDVSQSVVRLLNGERDARSHHAIRVRQRGRSRGWPNGEGGGRRMLDFA